MRLTHSALYPHTMRAASRLQAEEQAQAIVAGAEARGSHRHVVRWKPKDQAMRILLCAAFSVFCLLA
jgi:hypothetical protein